MHLGLLICSYTTDRSVCFDLPLDYLPVTRKLKLVIREVPSQTQLDTDREFARASRIGAHAYLTMRLDGRTHVSVELLEERVRMLVGAAHVIQAFIVQQSIRSQS
jgi:hypothetical protein